jgi:predicted nucleic acid-binding protein
MRKCLLDSDTLSYLIKGISPNEDHYERVPGLAVENWMSKDRD